MSLTNLILLYMFTYGSSHARDVLMFITIIRMSIKVASNPNALPLCDYAVSKHNKLCYLSVQSSSFSTLFFTLKSPATAASLLGLHSGASGFKPFLSRSSSVGLPHDSSNGYRFKLFPAVCFALLTIPSFPLINSWTMPNFHWFQFFHRLEL